MQEMVIYGVSFDLVGKQPIVLLKTADRNKFSHLDQPSRGGGLMKLRAPPPRGR
jgi:hypothetical protein